MRVARVHVLTILLLLLSTPVLSQSWSNEFGPPPSGKGLNSAGVCMTIYQDKLVVGGTFTQAGSTAANRIAMWDGSTWFALGSGFGANYIVEGVVSYNGELIAGGISPTYGGFLSRWNGSSWTPMTPPGTDQPFWTIALHDGRVFVNSWQAGANKLAWWNGLSWDSSALPNYFGIADMETYNGQLYLIGGQDAALYSWDGNTLGGPGVSFENYGYTLCGYDQLLYLGGIWIDGPLGTEAITAVWDGDSWLSFPVDMYYELNSVEAMTTYHGRLILGGSGGVTSFDGSGLVPMNGDNMYIAQDAIVFQGDLYVTGEFWDAGPSNPSSNIARWSEPVTGIGNTPAARSRLTVDSAPNPFNPSVTLSIRMARREHLVVTIHDTTGRKVKQLFSGILEAGAHPLAWNGTGDGGERLASGVYFARVASGNDVVNRKLVLVK